METAEQKYERLYLGVMSREITMDLFFAETKTDWEKLSTHYYYKGQRRNHYSTQDCFQDCCVGVYEAFEKYDPAVCNGQGSFYKWIRQQARLWLGKQLLKVRTGRASWSSYKTAEVIRETSLPDSYDVPTEHNFTTSEMICDVVHGKDLRSRLLLQSLLRTGDVQETKSELLTQKKKLFRNSSKINGYIQNLIEAQNV